MTSPVIPFLIALLTTAALSNTALAQDASQGNPAKEHERPTPAPQPPNVQNHVELNLRYHYDQPDPFLEKSHGQFQFGNRMNGFGYKGVFTFDPAPTANMALPLDVQMTSTLRQTTLTTGFGQVAQIITGNPRFDPPITKSGPLGAFSGADPGEQEDTARVPLFGPEFGYPLKNEVNEWGPVAWLPEGTSLHLYARMLFGETQLFDEDIHLQSYTLGPRLLVPLFSSDHCLLGATLSAGPAFLHTNVGNAFGFEAAAGLRLSLPLADSLCVITDVTISLYASDNVLSWGPGLTFGLAFSW